MGMSGVQVLGRDRGDVTEGRHNSTRCIRHGKRGATTGRPSHPHRPPPATYFSHYSVNEAARRLSARCAK